MKPQRVYACTHQDVPQVVVISEGFDHVASTQLAAFIVAAIAPAMDAQDGNGFPKRFPRRVNGGGDLLIECDSHRAARDLQDAIDGLQPALLVQALVIAAYACNQTQPHGAVARISGALHQLLNHPLFGSGSMGVEYTGDRGRTYRTALIDPKSHPLLWTKTATAWEQLRDSPWNHTPHFQGILVPIEDWQRVTSGGSS